MDRSLARWSLGIAMGSALCLSIPIREGQALAAAVTAEDSARVKQARQFYKEGQYEDAAKLFSSLSIEYPDKLVFTRNLGACYYYLNRPEPALSNLREYLKRKVDIAPDDRTEVEGWIAEMEKLRDQAAAAASAAPVVVAAPAPSPAQTLNEEMKNRPPAPVTPGQTAPPPVTGPTPDTGRSVYFAPVLTGGLHLAADGPGKVTVEGQDKGALPIDMTELYPGTYRIHIELQDGTIDERDVEVAAGRMTRIFVDRSPDRVSWLARQGAHLALEAGVGLLVGKKGSWTGAQGSAGGFLNLGIVPLVDFRAGLRFRYGSLGALNSVTLVEIPVSLRFNLGTTYSIALGTTVGKRWTNGNSYPVLYPETGFFFAPELSLLTLRFGKKREFEVAAVQGMAFPLSSSRGDYTLAWSSSALDIFYNTFTFSMVW